MLHSNRSHCQKLCGNYWKNVVYNHTNILAYLPGHAFIITNPFKYRRNKKERNLLRCSSYFSFFWKNTLLGNFFLKAYCLQHKFAFLKMENFDQPFHFCRFWALEGRGVPLFIFADNFPLFSFCLNDYFGCWEKRWVSCLQIPIQSQQ